MTSIYQFVRTRYNIVPIFWLKVRRSKGKHPLKLPTATANFSTSFHTATTIAKWHKIANLKWEVGIGDLKRKLFPFPIQRCQLCLGYVQRFIPFFIQDRCLRQFPHPLASLAARQKLFVRDLKQQNNLIHVKNLQKMVWDQFSGEITLQFSIPHRSLDNLIKRL